MKIKLKMVRPSHDQDNNEDKPNSTSNSTTTTTTVDNKKTSFHTGISNGLIDTVGETPLIKIESLSKATGCTILGKAEYMNPGGSPKDRVAKSIILDGEKQGKLIAGKTTIVEATAGSTGISLAMFGKSRGYNVELYIPDNVSKEKVDLLEMLGAKINIVPIVGMNNASHFMHCAYQRCLVDKSTFYANQFDNISNFNAHFYGTAKEIWQQTNGKIDGFVCAAGTGGTLGGISNYLKSRSSNIETWLIDPPGSGLYSLVNTGVIFDVRDRLVVDKFGPRSFYEGVGVNRKTENFAKAVLNGAFQGTEQEGVDMAHYLLRNDGLFLGGSSALNCAGAVKLARKLGPGKTIVTVLCDQGHRYTSRLYNKDWLAENDLTPTILDYNSLDFIK
ncbi:cysteine synthase [Heterostelium album PN500]|uniref:Cysteine synthase n=1 Tax=Heterostelium pallidum (strain ATCC 26659 / Pp 5 / PN500) TaxID=670386 RepID=D3BV85_HETP5|nr:cysteine synthase [Heterostelium album PN500]EFA74642.1 cysteine synthase [Heterostelium album PN500]|eukprot:XP_020426776.1 cysteine synthase [Heterostelium album PN500]